MVVLAPPTTTLLIPSRFTLPGTSLVEFGEGFLEPAHLQISNILGIWNSHWEIPNFKNHTVKVGTMIIHPPTRDVWIPPACCIQRLVQRSASSWEDRGHKKLARVCFVGFRDLSPSHCFMFGFLIDLIPWFCFWSTCTISANLPFLILFHDRISGWSVSLVLFSINMHNFSKPSDSDFAPPFQPVTLFGARGGSINNGIQWCTGSAKSWPESIVDFTSPPPWSRSSPDLGWSRCLVRCSICFLPSWGWWRGEFWMMRFSGHRLGGKNSKENTGSGKSWNTILFWFLDLIA